MHRDHGVLALQPRQNREDPVRQGALLATQELCDEFGIGVRLEIDARLLELLPQTGVVLDDAIVDHRHKPFAVGLRVGVGLGGSTVRRPPRVTNAGCPVEGLVIRLLLEVLELTGGAQDSDLVGAHHCHAGGVVTAVLEATQAVEQYRHHLVRAHITDDATHLKPPIAFAD